MKELKLDDNGKRKSWFTANFYDNALLLEYMNNPTPELEGTLEALGIIPQINNSKQRKNIINSILNEIREDLQKNVTETLLKEDEEIGYVKRFVKDYGNSQIDIKKQFEEDLGVMPKKIYNLGVNYGVGFIPNKIIGTKEEGAIGRASVKFINESECTEEEKKLIEERKSKVALFRQKVQETDTEEYDKIGIITIPMYLVDTVENLSKEKMERDTKTNKGVSIRMTQRQLAQAGILPEDFGWKETKKVSSKDIAEEDKKQKFTTIEMGKIKGIVDKIMDKFKAKDKE